MAHWLRLTLIPGVGGQTQRQLLSRFGLPQQVFAAGRAALAPHLSPAQLEALLHHDAGSDIAIAREWAQIPGNAIVTLADAGYPRSLLDIPDPPTLLYVKGRVELLSRPALAVVGSRNPTAQGRNHAEAFARALSCAGLTVVSGMALGIDAAAHRGALEGDGATVAVIGTGADRVYPARNRELAHDIASRGAIVSEFPLTTPPLTANFPRRNRLISGLSRGVLVVEAAQQSGSLITARLATEQGRDVFAIPGSIHSPQSKGCHQLIKQGAKLVDCTADILDELRLEPPALPPQPAPPPIASLPEAGPKLAVLAAAGFDPCDMDTLAQRTGLTIDALCAILLELELESRLAQLPGGRYQRLS
ncbi:MAG: DNA-protecting protein DprA [Betaproteobacteria bacterium]|nr:DNA-protecting protein DprA [Betaproteobacteria bacterium]